MITSLDLSRIDDQLRKCERSKTALVLTREQGRDECERGAAADKKHHEWRFGTPEGRASLAAQWKKARAERLANEAAPR